MKTFLQELNAAFYHITTIENWNAIKQTGINSEQKKIFVSSSGELSILFAILVDQLNRLDVKSEEIVFLKLSHAKNNFIETEIKPDTQAGVEWTQPFQYIIKRQTIPFANIELAVTLQLGTGLQRTKILTQISNIANEGRINYEHAQREKSTNR